MITDRWCLFLDFGDNCWNDSSTRETCTGEIFYTHLRADVGALREITEFAAANGCDSVIIDIANGIKFKTHPEIAAEDAWEPEFFKKELQRMSELGLKTYPRLNFSAGHDAWLGVYGRMVSTPKYYEVCRELIHEVIDIFDTPELMSLVMDEENGLNQGRLDYACYRQYDLVWHDLNYLLDCIREKGVRPCIGADYYWSFPQEFLDNVPRDVLVCPWFYLFLYEDAEHKFPMDSWSVTRRKCFKDLTEAGFDIMLQGAGHENTFNFEHTIRYAKENLDESKIYGMMICGSWAAPTEDSKYYYMDAIYQAKYAREALLGGE